MTETVLPRSRSWFARVSAAVLLLWAAVPSALAQEDLSEVSGEDLVKTSTFASVGAIHPGEQFEVAVHYEIAPHWHLYWSNPGESGMPPDVSITAPEGFEVGSVQWPTPEVFRSTEVTYGYSKEAVLLVAVKAPDTLEPGSLEFEVQLKWLVCRKVCLFGAREHQIKLAVARNGRDVPPAAAEQRLLATWRARMPIPMKKAPSATARIEKGHLLMAGPAGSAKTAWFYADDTPGVHPTTIGPVKGRVLDGRYLFDILLVIEPENALGEPLRAAGLVVLGTPGGTRPPRAISIDIPITTGGDESSSS